MRRSLIAYFAMLFCAGLLLAEQVGELVFVGGTRIAVSKAELRDGMVWITTDKGVMQAYPVEEVDLGASGLLPEPPTPSGAEAEDSPNTALNVPASLRRAQSKSTGTSNMRITDADVDHVEPEALLGPEGVDEGASTTSTGSDAFSVTDLQHAMRGERLNVTGTVTNNSDEQAAGLDVLIAAKDADGVTIGQGAAHLRRILEPGASSPFSVMILGVSGRVAELSGTARSLESGQQRRLPVPAPPAVQAPASTRDNEMPD